MSDESPVSRACLLTPPGRGAVAVVAAEGPAAMSAVDAHFRAANGRRLADQPADRPAFGRWDAEEVVVLRGAQSVEIHCHGGVVSSARILDALAAAGCTIEPWPERLRRTAGDPIQAEADVALAAATTRRTAAMLLDQRGGALRRAVEQIRETIASGELESSANQINALLRSAAIGLHLVNPWRVVLAGRPNVGKSSLLNALAGYQRAIVHDQPGTTRDVLAVETAIDGWPVRLIDAAGLRTTADPLEAAGVELARATLAGADVVVWVLDATTLDGVRDLAAIARQQLAADDVARADAAAPLIVVNKIDLAPDVADLVAHQAPAVVLLSGVTGAGLDRLLDAVAQQLAPQVPAPGAPLIFTMRQSELIEAAHQSLAGGDVTSALAGLGQLLGQS